MWQNGSISVLFQLCKLCNKYRCVKEQWSHISHSTRGWIDCAQQGWGFCNHQRLGLRSSWRSGYWPVLNARILRQNRCGSEGTSVCGSEGSSLLGASGEPGFLHGLLGLQRHMSHDREAGKRELYYLLFPQKPCGGALWSYSRRGLLCYLLVEKVSKNL